MIEVSGHFENKQWPISIVINGKKPQYYTLLAAKELRDKLDECLSFFSDKLIDADIEKSCADKSDEMLAEFERRDENIQGI